MPGSKHTFEHINSPDQLPCWHEPGGLSDLRFSTSSLEAQPPITPIRAQPYEAESIAPPNVCTNLPEQHFTKTPHVEPSQRNRLDDDKRREYAESIRGLKLNELLELLPKDSFRDWFPYFLKETTDDPQKYIDNKIVMQRLSQAFDLMAEEFNPVERVAVVSLSVLKNWLGHQSFNPLALVIELGLGAVDCFYKPFDDVFRWAHGYNSTDFSKYMFIKNFVRLGQNPKSQIAFRIAKINEALAQLPVEIPYIPDDYSYGGYGPGYRGLLLREESSRNGDY